MIELAWLALARPLFPAACALAAASLLAACADSPDADKNLHRTMPRTVMQDCDRAEFDSPPVLVQGDQPDFPRVLHQNFTGGQVKVTFVVTPAGTTDHVGAEAPGDWRFAAFAGVAVQGWHFEPAKKAGVAVAAHCTMKLDITAPS
jgi:outer membrane biosynthesis protein TonB